MTDSVSRETHTLSETPSAPAVAGADPKRGARAVTATRTVEETSETVSETLTETTDTVALTGGTGDTCVGGAVADAAAPSAAGNPPRRAHRVLTAALGFARHNVVLLVAFVAALVTAFLVPPDQTYLSYIDFSTLSCLFSTLAVVAALRHIRFFTVLAERIVALTGSLRACMLALTYITFIGSMLIANDMALLTFLPLSCYVLTSTGEERHMAFAFILQNAAANLGGMLTPFGNPQNLYLYGYFHIPTGAFTLTMLPPFLVAMAIITVLCFVFFPREPIRVRERPSAPLPRVRTGVYLGVFLLVILSVFRLLPYYAALAAVVLTLLIADRRAFRDVDYPLLLTFVCFFIFSGNMVRIPAVGQFFSSLLSRNALLVSMLSCQVISNVPTAILLAGFAPHWRPLLLGVNIGGVGTLISSMASLITLRTYLRANPGGAGRYLLRFTWVNALFLAVLFGVCTLQLHLL